MRFHHLRYVAPASIVTVFAIAGCSTTSGGATSEHTSSYSWAWAPITGATEVISADSIAALTRESDVVALGRFTERCEPRRMGGPGGDGQTYGCLVFEADSALAGDASVVAEPLPVEFLGDPPHEGLPSSHSIAFLLDKGGEEAGRFRIVNSFGLYSSTPRAVVDQPMREHAPTVEQLSAHGLRSGAWEQFVTSVQDEIAAP